MAGFGLLRGARGGSRNIFTVRKRVPPEGDPGNVGGAGRPVPRAGTWPRRAARGAGQAGQPATQCGEPGQGLSISYMEGPCLILSGRSIPAAPPRHACRRRNAPSRWSAGTSGTAGSLTGDGTRYS